MIAGASIRFVDGEKSAPVQFGAADQRTGQVENALVASCVLSGLGRLGTCVSEWLAGNRMDGTTELASIECPALKTSPSS